MPDACNRLSKKWNGDKREEDDHHDDLPPDHLRQRCMVHINSADYCHAYKQLHPPCIRDFPRHFISDYNNAQCIEPRRDRIKNEKVAERISANALEIRPE